MHSLSKRLIYITIVLLLSHLTLCYCGKADVYADAERRRAAITPEELAKSLAENTITDADLLPTRPAPKQYTPSGEPEFGLLMSPGLGKGCNLKRFPNLQQFLKEDAKYYPDLIVDYFVIVDPKLKFYQTKSQRDNAMVHGELMSEDDILSLLQNGPDSSKEPLLSIELSDEDPEPAELRWILQQHNIARAEVPDENHSSQRIFKPDFVPIED